MIEQFKSWLAKYRYERRIRGLIDELFDITPNLKGSKNGMFGMFDPFNLDDQAIRIGENMWVGLFAHAVNDDDHRYVVLSESGQLPLDQTTIVFDNHVLMEGIWETQVVSLLENAIEKTKRRVQQEKQARMARDLQRVKG